MGSKREVIENYYLGIPSQSRIIRSYQLFLALSKYQELFTGRAVLSCLEGELYDNSFPSHAIKGTGIPSCKGDCTIDSEELEINPCYHLQAWLGKPFPLILQV